MWRGCRLLSVFYDLVTLQNSFRRSRGWVFFFFQAEDGIRDHCVTGVQTCALPISSFQLIKLTDFGIAKMAEAEIDEVMEDTTEESITGSQTVVGALPFMAPELI